MTQSEALVPRGNWVPSRQQLLYLCELAANARRSTKAICEAASIGRSGIAKWRQRESGFSAMEALIRANPQAAAAWLLLYSQPQAVVALIANLSKGGRTATDAAGQILREARERLGVVPGEGSLEAALDRILARREAAQAGDAPEESAGA